MLLFTLKHRVAHLLCGIHPRVAQRKQQTADGCRVDSIWGRLTFSQVPSGVALSLSSSIPGSQQRQLITKALQNLRLQQDLLQFKALYFVSNKPTVGIQSTLHVKNIPSAIQFRHYLEVLQVKNIIFFLYLKHLDLQSRLLKEKEDFSILRY